MGRGCTLTRRRSIRYRKIHRKLFEHLSSRTSNPHPFSYSLTFILIEIRYTFGAAGWYLREKCDKEIHEKLTEGGYEGFSTYVKECLEAGNVESGRLEVWCKTIDALTPAGIPHPEQCSPK